MYTFLWNTPYIYWHLRYSFFPVWRSTTRREAGVIIFKSSWALRSGRIFQVEESREEFVQFWYNFYFFDKKYEKIQKKSGNSIQCGLNLMSFVLLGGVGCKKTKIYREEFINRSGRINQKNVWKSDKSWEPEKIWKFENFWKF